MAHAYFDETMPLEKAKQMLSGQAAKQDKARSTATKFVYVLRNGEALVERCALGRDGHFRRRQRLYGWQLRQRCRGVRGSPRVRQFLQAFLHHEPSLGRAVGALWLARDGTRLSSAVPTLSSASRPSTERRRAIAHHDASRRQRSQRRATEAAAAIATAVRSALVRATPDVGRQ